MHWFDRAFTRPGFRHCFVLWQPENLALMPLVTVQPLYSGIVISYSAGVLAEEVIARWLTDPFITTIVQIDVDQGDRVPYVWRGPLTCVTVVKQILGVHAWWIQTPRQLYRFLLQRGGVRWANP